LITLQVKNIFASNITREYYDAILEIYFVTFAIGNLPIVKQLKHDVEDIGMSLGAQEKALAGEDVLSLYQNGQVCFTYLLHFIKEKN
jgi:hypothetical protein